MNKEDRLHITLNAILYILNRLGGTSDFLKVFKILYFAEMEHLSKYGRMFTENQYKALPKGPVPNSAYEGLKYLRGDADAINFEDKNAFEEKLRVFDNHYISSKSSEDLDELSLSEIKCLEFSITDNKDLSFAELSAKSHGAAWESSKKGCAVIPLVEIAKEAKMNDEMIQYSLNQETLKTASFY